MQSRSRETIDKQWSVCTRPFTQCARLQYKYTPTVGAHLRSLCMRALPHFGLGILAIPCDTVRGYVCETCRSCRSCRSCPLLSDCRTVGPCWDSYDSLGQSIHMVTGVFAVVVLSDSVGAVGAVDCRSCRSCRSAVGVLSDFAVVLSTVVPGLKFCRETVKCVDH